MPSQQYVPVLKAKAAEIEALRSLPVASSDVLPLFEVQSVLKPAFSQKTGTWTKRKSAPAEVAGFLDLVELFWTAPLMIDISRVADAPMRASWWNLLQALDSIRPTGATLIPVVRLDDPSAALHAAAPLAAKADAAAVRVTMPSNPAMLTAGLPALAAQLGVTLDKVTVLLDWGSGLEITAISLDNAVLETTSAITALPAGLARVVTVGTPDTSPAQQDGYWTFTRREWWLWLRARAAMPELVFGDYALFPPSDPVPASPRYGYLRYSADDVLHIWREAPPASGGGNGGAYEVCCQKVATDPVFCGAPFSPADRTIEDIATGSVATNGHPQVWRQHALSHHFHLVRSQLASPPAAPPAGTP